MESTGTEIKITATINGKDVQLPADMSLARYLTSRDLKERLVAVELNGSILNRADFESTMISDGDRVEIVHFVGGG